MRLLRLLGLLGTLVFCRTAAKCVAPSPYFQCHGAAVIVVDGTHHMHSHEQIKEEISYLHHHIVPGLGLRKEFEVAFMLSGVGDNGRGEARFVSSHKDACSELESLKDLADKKGLQKESLKKILEHISSHYGHDHPVILFSRSDDEDEISEAGEHARKHLRNDITVVALSGKEKPWRKFPAVSVYPVDVSDLDASDGLDYCIAERSCAITNECHLHRDVFTTARNTHKSSTPAKHMTERRTTRVATTSPKPSSSKPEPLRSTTTTHPPTTSSVVVNVEETGCTCNYSTSWNDVMLVFEATEATTETGLQEMLVHVQSNLYRFNIQSYPSSDQLCTRIGVVVYGLTPRLYAPLGSLSRDDFLAIDTFPYFGDQIANLEDALRMAALQFQTEADRPNARNVIVLMATSYYVGGAFAPGQVAAQFKEDNGVLVVYNYVEEHGFPETELESLASPGYFLTNTEDNNGDAIRRALCDANCFCRLGYDTFGKDPLRNTPTAGCYSAKQAQTNYQLATNRCRSEGGFIALGKEQNQTEYLDKKFNSGSSFWIGLKWEQIKQSYEWADGSALASTAQPWASSPSPHQTGVDCVRVVPQGSNLVWAPVDCRETFTYSCEVSPCDSQTFCTQDV